MSPSGRPQPIAVLGSKGGVAATTVAILIGTAARPHAERSLLVDLTGDIGIAVCPWAEIQPGIAEVLRAGPTERTVAKTVVGFADGPYDLLPRGTGALEGTPQAWAALWRAVETYDGQVVIDAGRVEHAGERLAGSSARRVLVSTRSYQSYWRTMKALSAQENGLERTADSWVLVDSGNMQLDSMADRLDRSPDLLVPWSGAIGRWMDEGLILAKGHEAARLFESLLEPAGEPDRSLTKEDDDDGLGL